MSNGQETKSLMAADLVITGTIKSSSGIRIDGKLEGEIHCSADVVVGKSAVIKGNVMVQSVILEGEVQGNITAKDKIEMKSGCKVNGDITAKRMTVEDGVTFIGRAEVTPSGAGAATAGVKSSVEEAIKPAPAVSSRAEAPKGEESSGSGLFGRRSSQG
jgi:cytoskeletal protein CcmA (bactofilin family)